MLRLLEMNVRPCDARLCAVVGIWKEVLLAERKTKCQQGCH